MTRWCREARLTAVLFVLLLAVAPLRLGHAHSLLDLEPLQIRLVATDVGIECLEGCDVVHFNGNPWEYAVEVNAGTLVELTFVWGHQGYIQEEHIMVLDGYKLEWDKIDYYNQEATLQFIADSPGTFGFKCDLECDLHDYMQRGHLKVTRAGGESGSAAFTPTTLAVSPSTWATAGKTITFMTLLKGANGAPVSKAEVRFYLDAEFAGTQGQMEIGKARTDANGVAFLDFRPTLPMRQQVITARFAGMGVYDASEQTIEIEETGIPPAAYTIAPVGLASIRHYTPWVLAIVVLGIWATFGFVLYQVYRIWRVRAGDERV